MQVQPIKNRGWSVDLDPLQDSLGSSLYLVLSWRSWTAKLSCKHVTARRRGLIQDLHLYVWHCTVYITLWSQGSIYNNGNASHFTCSGSELAMSWVLVMYSIQLNGRDMLYFPKLISKLHPWHVSYRMCVSHSQSLHLTVFWVMCNWTWVSLMGTC